MLKTINDYQTDKQSYRRIDSGQDGLMICYNLQKTKESYHFDTVDMFKDN